MVHCIIATTPWWQLRPKTKKTCTSNTQGLLIKSCRISNPKNELGLQLQKESTPSARSDQIRSPKVLRVLVTHTHIPTNSPKQLNIAAMAQEASFNKCQKGRKLLEMASSEKTIQMK
jgi:hypothetical protein